MKIINTVFLRRFVNVCNLQNALCNFEIMHAHFANFLPKSDPNPSHNPNLTLTIILVKSSTTFYKLCRLTNCMQHILIVTSLLNSNPPFSLHLPCLPCSKPHQHSAQPRPIIPPNPTATT